jgi:hypothetical protein
MPLYHHGMIDFEVQEFLRRIELQQKQEQEKRINANLHPERPKMFEPRKTIAFEDLPPGKFVDVNTGRVFEKK